MITLQTEFAAVETAARAAEMEQADRDALELVELSLDDLEQVGGGAYIYQW